MTPVTYAIIAVVVLPLATLLLLKLFCILTVGRCRSQRDMTGKTVLITGATAGIGKATAFDMARRSARVILACRNLKKAEMVKSEIVTATRNTNIEIKLLDLESFDSVRKCAEDVLRTEERLDVLINNAGRVTISSLEMTKDGCERSMQTNHLGPFLLTLLLLDLLKKSKPSRIINVSSLGYIVGYLNFDDMDGSKHNFFMRHMGNYYYRSKLASVMATRELARRLEGTGITVNALHPGFIHTRVLYEYEHPVLWFYRFCQICFGKTVEEGAQTTIYLAVHPEVENVTGRFFCDCRESLLILGQARSKEKSERLFQISEEIVGERFPDQTKL